jgi:hypothetical protein
VEVEELLVGNIHVNIEWRREDAEVHCHSEVGMTGRCEFYGNQSRMRVT